jgi:hypothetical protein
MLRIVLGGYADFWNLQEGDPSYGLPVFFNFSANIFSWGGLRTDVSILLETSHAVSGIKRVEAPGQAKGPKRGFLQ